MTSQMAEENKQLRKEIADLRARAALRSSVDLSVLLAGSQLGITVCTLALGAIAKPAVRQRLTPLLQSWGLPLGLADAAGFVLALVSRSIDALDTPSRRGPGQGVAPSRSLRRHHWWRWARRRRLPRPAPTI